MTTPTATADPAAASDDSEPETSHVGTARVHAGSLRFLLDGIARFAGNDTGLPILNAVRVRTTDMGDLTAVATDRYRAGILRVPTIDREVHAGDIDAVIPLRAVDDVVRLLTPAITDRPDLGATPTVVVLEQTDDRLTISIRDEDPPSVRSFATDLITGPDYPQVERIIRAALDSAPDLTVPIGINPRLLADLEDLSGGFTEPMRIWASAPDRPLAVGIGDHFVGVLMPTSPSPEDRHGGHFETYDAQVWGPILGDPADLAGSEGTP